MPYHVMPPDLWRLAAMHRVLVYQYLVVRVLVAERSRLGWGKSYEPKKSGQGGLVSRGRLDVASLQTRSRPKPTMDDFSVGIRRMAWVRIRGGHVCE